MDNAAVLRWLDDIGLPQHKEAFQIAKIDGRVLHRLMTEDLLNLGVISQLHAASLRRGIQVSVTRLQKVITCVMIFYLARLCYRFCEI